MEFPRKERSVWTLSAVKMRLLISCQRSFIRKKYAILTILYLKKFLYQLEVLLREELLYQLEVSLFKKIRYQWNIILRRKRTRLFWTVDTQGSLLKSELEPGLLCDLTSTNTLTVPDVSFVKWEPAPYICTVCLEKQHPVNFHTSTEEIFQNLPDLTFE